VVVVLFHRLFTGHVKVKKEKATHQLDMPSKQPQTTTRPNKQSAQKNSNRIVKKTAKNPVQKAAKMAFLNQEAEVKRPEFVAADGAGSDLECSDDDSDVGTGRKALLKRANDVDVEMEAGSDKEQAETEATEKYRQRVLVITSRGITHRFRHLMKDVCALLPHSKMDSKLDSKSMLGDINEIAQVSSPDLGNSA
jgi:hypothetical protein